MGNLVSAALSRSDSSILIRSRTIKKSWSGLVNGTDGSFANLPAITCSHSGVREWVGAGGKKGGV